ncbi:MAG: protein-glutamine gamma-glutamyltransferase [Oscillospiraceae bacterium]|nr:protein-glutamine gamma-glutamyltransferase [Oscillospiraceae bacterium]
MITNQMYTEFEEKLRRAICDAAYALNESGMAFAVFTNTKCNEKYWNRTNNGGWRLKPGGVPASAVSDIFDNGWQYATECATAMEIVYYKALLEVYGDELFNRTFHSIYLMDWDIREPLLSKAGNMFDVPGLIAGDRGYFANPDHDPALPQWQGENVIVLSAESGGTYYGHGIGISNGKDIIDSLNSRRKSDNPRSAYLMTRAGRPDFKKLADVMYSEKTVAVWKEFPPAVPVMGVPGKNGTFHFV